jgi:hypothetical protein
VSEGYAGCSHDYSILKSEFSPDYEWFKHYTVRVDLGYLGFDKDYVCPNFFLPHKKPKGGELTSQQKAANKEQASDRVKVEHSIGGMKRYRILSDRLRIHNVSGYNDILEVCAGLWNFYIIS